MCYILDVGGGDNPCGNIVLDIIPPSIKKLDVNYVVGDACSLPFRSNSFSKVVTHGALNYFINDVDFFKEVTRILKKKGLIVVSALSYYSFILNCIDLLKRNPVGAFRLVINTIRKRYRFYTIKSLKNMLTYSGFKVLMIHPNVYLPWRPTTTPYNILVVAIISAH